MNQVMPVPLGLTHWFHHWRAKVLSVRCSDAGSLCGLMAFDGRTSTVWLVEMLMKKVMMMMMMMIIIIIIIIIFFFISSIRWKPVFSHPGFIVIFPLAGPPVPFSPDGQVRKKQKTTPCKTDAPVDMVALRFFVVGSKKKLFLVCGLVESTRSVWLFFGWDTLARLATCI